MGLATVRQRSPTLYHTPRAGRIFPGRFEFVARLDPASLPAYNPVSMLAGRITTAALTHAVVLTVSLLNLAYVAIGCPLDLSPDEAHYWDWSRHLDLSYYSKGPLVAWLIRASCDLFGTSVAAVRLPAVVCGGLLLAGIGRIAATAFQSERFALVVILLALTLPPFSAASVLMTIDPPFLACWAWATVAVQNRRWHLAGVLVAIGTLAKYTMLLFPACVGLMMLTHPQWRTRWFVSFLALSLLGLVPVFVWNLANDWVGLRHLLGHADNGGRPAEWFSPLVFVAGQGGLLLGIWFVACAVGVWHYRPSREGDQTLAPLWWLSVPVFAVFLLASVRTSGQPNWPAAAYVTGFILAVRVITHCSKSWVRNSLIVAAVFLGVALSLALRWPNLVRPTLASILAQPTDHTPTPIRRLDPTARLVGWRTLASAVNRVRLERIEQFGEEPLLGAMAWTVPGELGFYCENHPQAYSFGAAVGDRFSQYDLWRPNPVSDAQAFAGRTFVYVGDEPPPGVFDRVEFACRVTHSECGVPLATWSIWVCTGYRGFTRLSPGRY